MSEPQAARSSSVKSFSMMEDLSSSTFCMRAALSASLRAADISSRCASTRSATDGSAAWMV